MYLCEITITGFCVNGKYHVNANEYNGVYVNETMEIYNSRCLRKYIEVHLKWRIVNCIILNILLRFLDHIINGEIKINVKDVKFWVLYKIGRVFLERNMEMKIPNLGLHTKKM